MVQIPAARLICNSKNRVNYSGNCKAREISRTTNPRGIPAHLFERKDFAFEISSLSRCSPIVLNYFLVDLISIRTCAKLCRELLTYFFFYRIGNTKYVPLRVENPRTVGKCEGGEKVCVCTPCGDVHRVEKPSICTWTVEKVTRKRYTDVRL